MKGITFAFACANVFDAPPMALTSSKQTRPDHTLENLRAVLAALDLTGDFSLSSIIELRRILAERVFALERLEEIRSSVSNLDRIGVDTRGGTL